MWPLLVVTLILHAATTVLSNNISPVFQNLDTTLVIQEDIPVGKVLRTLNATDADGPLALEFSISSSITEQLVELGPTQGDNTNGRTVDIKLKTKLDRDYTTAISYDLHFQVSDNKDKGNVIEVIITMYVTDVNDENPTFVSNRYDQDVLENATFGSVVEQVSATDPDQGKGSRITYSMEALGQAVSEDYKNAFIIDPVSGKVMVNTQLDANIHNYYEYTLIARDDPGLEGRSRLLIKIKDVQNKPPYFTNLPYSKTIKENITVNSEVLQVTALDGDKGIPNNVTYSIVSGDQSKFALDSSTGFITVKSTLDRDNADVAGRGGVFAIYVKARENDQSQPVERITATTLVTITVEDINDNAPRFNSPNYDAAIQENMQEGVPVTFTSPTFMTVEDIDQGANSVFELHLQKDGAPYTDFDTQPKVIYSESSVLLRVQNKTALDYEKVTDIVFQIVAVEKDTVEHKSSTATVTIHVQDMNDNAPVFNPDSYPVLELSEAALDGALVIDLNATDLDQGEFGDITYGIRGSHTKFRIDPASGIIRLAGSLDRETVDSYFLTAEARDGGGLITFVNLEIRVLDENDNSPVFRRQEYYATVKENSLDFIRENLIVQATDDDQANTKNSQVMYRILKASAGLQNKFSVDPTSGLITVVEEINYEDLPLSLNGRILLEVEAYDQGTPVRRTAINITIEVEDVNDNAPVFTKSTYSASIAENAASESFVIKVDANDLDSTAPNNDIKYGIDSGAGDKFRINFETGAITVERREKLNREDKDVYFLNVSASDRGAVSLFGFCVVQITVTDVNDEPPRFDEDVISKSVMENAGTGTEVVCAVAQDPDLNDLLRFTIVPKSIQAYNEMGQAVNVTSSGVQNYFEMDASSGCVKVKSSLDRETAETVTMRVQVEDQNAVADASQRAQTDTATVTITIKDYNDNAPEFMPSNLYALKISEGLDSGSEVLRIETHDKDKNQDVTYTIKSDPDDNFSIGTNTGILRLKNRLNREDKSSLLVSVVATDSGSPALSAEATISVTVQDINDNNPVFLPHGRDYTVREDADVDDIITTISATDKDDKEFARIVYSFDISNSDGKLKIDRNTGEIKVAQKLDREVRGFYTLFITATDNPSDPENQRTNQTTINIQVEDVNDNDPVFTNIDASTEATVLENAVSGFVVFSVSAEDNDIGDNAHLDYSLTANETVQQLFTIKTEPKIISGVPKYIGVIQVGADLLGMVGTLFVNVTATDRGTPARSVEARLAILVEDVNLHQPVFMSPTGPQASINTLEEQPIGTFIFQIVAKDEDHGRNKDITYEIQKENDWEKFLIDPRSGNLTNKVILDRETRPTYEIKIKAEDNGIPNPLYSTLTLTINLRDKDDNPPEFPRGKAYEPYIIQIEEERVNDQTRTDLDVAVDKDENTVTCYYIIGGDADVSTFFSLDPKGILTLTQALDRESLSQPYINIIVFATPRCYVDIADDLRGAIYPPVDYYYNKTLLWVKVEIKDINDNPPVFKQSVLTLGVTRATGYHTPILNLQDLITDKDATMKLDFFGLSTKQFLQGSPVSGEPFRVFRNGTVITNTFFHSNMYGYFLIHIQAKENVTGGEPFIANTTLRISLINDDQRVKVIFKNTPNTVRAFQVDFTQELQNVTKYRIVVDKIQTHENKFGQAEVNKTDMFIHGENLKTNETIPASELIRVIDLYADSLLNLRFNYKVLDIVPTVMPVEEDSLENTYKMALILVSIGLTLLCVAISIVFYISRQQYKRKLKAATAMAYGSNADLQKLEMPGTNVHAYENTNPIYAEKVMLDVAGELDDDDDGVDLDNNAVNSHKPSSFTEQGMAMNFYTEDNNLNKVPESKLGNGDAILNAALQHHEATRLNNGVAHTNNVTQTKEDNFTGLPTTEI